MYGTNVRQIGGMALRSALRCSDCFDPWKADHPVYCRLSPEDYVLTSVQSPSR